MKTFTGIDLGSTTTKAVMLDESGDVLGQGITNSRSNYDVAAAVARGEAMVSARFTLLERELTRDPELASDLTRVDLFRAQLQREFRLGLLLRQLELLHEVALEEADAERVRHIRAPLRERLEVIFERMERDIRRPFEDPRARKKQSHFFRDMAASSYSRQAERLGDEDVSFDDLMGIFDKAIIQVENTPLDLTFETNVRSGLDAAASTFPPGYRERALAAVERASGVTIEELGTIGTGYGRARLPFPRECIRSEILCHGLGAHIQFPDTRTVLDIGGQDTKAIQVDEDGIVTSFQMNDRCAAGCGRYLGYIADEMNLGVHELGPIAMQSTRRVKITSTCTVFAGAELRDRLSNGQRREDILAGLHRAIVLRAMALLARSGGIDDEFTFTGGVANNTAAVRALEKLVEENYGERTLNIDPDSIYTGALGAAVFCMRAGGNPDQPDQPEQSDAAVAA